MRHYKFFLRLGFAGIRLVRSVSLGTRSALTGSYTPENHTDEPNQSYRERKHERSSRGYCGFSLSCGAIARAIPPALGRGVGPRCGEHETAPEDSDFGAGRAGPIAARYEVSDVRLRSDSPRTRRVSPTG